MQMGDKIDFVVLWVDGLDAKWQREKKQYKPEYQSNGNSENRYRDWGLMKYWFRGIEKYASWVNKIFFVTNGQIPSWLNTKHPKLRLVEHKDYIPEKYLPTFNSNVIELWLHRIPDLSEHFVLFNDDMFLINKVTPREFFKNGYPCDAALMDIATAPNPEDCLPHILVNNFSIINKHFSKKQVLKENRNKFFTSKYGKDILRNILLFPFRDFSCFRDLHLASSHLKSTFVHIWEEEGELLEQCANQRFRSKSDFSHWLMKCWHICEGRFEVRSTKWGHHFELWEDEIEEICRCIEQHKYQMICLNDSKADIAFEKTKERLIKSFETIFSEKSEYENIERK